MVLRRWNSKPILLPLAPSEPHTPNENAHSLYPTRRLRKRPTPSIRAGIFLTLASQTPVNRQPAEPGGIFELNPATQAEKLAAVPQDSRDQEMQGRSRSQSRG